MNRSNIFGYLLGLLIFVIGIPALMWLVSGRPWLYVPDSVVQCVIAVLLAVCGLSFLYKPAQPYTDQAYTLSDVFPVQV